MNTKQQTSSEQQLVSSAQDGEQGWETLSLRSPRREKTKSGQTPTGAKAALEIRPRPFIWTRGLLLVWLGIMMLLGLQMPAPAHAAYAKIVVDSVLNADGTLNLTQDTNGTLDLKGWNVTLDALRGPVLTRAETAPQAPADAVDWEAQSFGVDGDVLALAFDPLTQSVYAGGSFQHACTASDCSTTGVESHGIAEFPLGGPVMTALPNKGVNGNVSALATTLLSQVYLGGNFANTYDSNSVLVDENNTPIAMNRVAGYTPLPGGDASWHNLDLDPGMPSTSYYYGLNGPVYAIAVLGTHVYVGGAFEATTRIFNNNDAPLTNIADFDTTTKFWKPLPGHGLTANKGAFSGRVNALATDGTKLYVGGQFVGTYDTDTTDCACNSQVLNNLAVYDPLQPADTAWSPVQSFAGFNGVHGTVNALLVDNSDSLHPLLFVGGSFDGVGTSAQSNYNNIAVFDVFQDTWLSFLEGGIQGTVNALEESLTGQQIFVGGSFSSTYDGFTTLSNIARYDYPKGTWHALPDQGVNGEVNAIAIGTSNGTPYLFIGGKFSGAKNPQPSPGNKPQATPALNHIAKIPISAATTAVDVANFRAAKVTAQNVTLKWQTMTESQLAGFNVWRKTGKQKFQQVNARFIQARFSGDPSGASYQFKNAIKSGKTYQYRIEVVYLDGHSDWTNMLRVKTKSPASK